MTATSGVRQMAGDQTQVQVDGVDVRISSPSKVLFPEQGWTKMDLVEHYLTCWPGALRGVFGRPVMLKRWNTGVGGEPVFQKRAPKGDGIQEFVTVSFPSGRTAEMFVPRRGADVVWLAQQNCIDLNPWSVRAEDVDRPDELRFDLDPTPGVPYDVVRRVAQEVGSVLGEDGLRSWPKTSGGRGLHVYARLQAEWSFIEVRRAVLAVAREVERRLPTLATTAWWKEERHGVFIDYNQAARDRTMASAYSVRQTGLVSTPTTWEDLPDVEPQDFPMDRFADHFARVGDLTDGIDQAPGRLEGLLDRARRDDENGLEDAPWPPHFPRQASEPPRVPPSRRKHDEPEP